MSDESDVSAETDRRSPDQDAAVEAAFVAGVLPEEDRRGDATTYFATEAETLNILNAAGVGSEFRKEAHGWTVKLVDGGTVIHVQGPTIPEAVANYGAQVEHPKSREQLAREAALQ